MLAAVHLVIPLAMYPAFADEDSLSRLVREAGAQHPMMAAQAALVRAAGAGVDAARWQYFPTPSISAEDASTRAQDSAYAGDRRVVVIGLRQPLWTGGRLDAGLAKAQANARRSGASQAEVRQQIGLRVIQAYGEWYAAAERRKVFSAGLALHRDLRDLVARRVREGQSAQSDLTLAEQRLAALEADSVAAMTQESVGLVRLGQLVGRAVSSEELLARPSSVLSVSPNLAGLLQDVEAVSPLLARQRALAEMQLAAIDERKADIWPEIHARLERQYGNHAVAGQPSETRLFIDMSSRLGAGLSTTSAIAEARGAYEAALAEVDVQLRALHEQIVVDYALLSQSESRRRALLDARDLSGRVLASWDRQFLSGRKSWQDLMNSAREQVQMEAQLADLDASRLVASWRIHVLSHPIALNEKP